MAFKHPNNRRKTRISANQNKQSAMLFVVLMGLVSLFADMTHEGARSITGPLLALLGVSSPCIP